MRDDRGEQNLLGRTSGGQRLHPNRDVGMFAVPPLDEPRRETHLGGIGRRPVGQGYRRDAAPVDDGSACAIAS